MMFGNNKNYDWILCSSKSFPGKFYYFNTQTRQAVWNLNDLEKHVISQNYFQDKYHNYPEPDTPPMDTESSLWIKKEIPSYSRPPIPSYGPSFSKPNLDYRNWGIPANIPSGPAQPMYFPRQVEKPWGDRYVYQNLENAKFGFHEQEMFYKNIFVNPNSNFESSTPASSKWGFDRNFVQKQSIFNAQEYKLFNRNYQEAQKVTKRPLLRDSAFQLYRTPTVSTKNTYRRTNNLFDSELRLVQSRSLESLINCKENLSNRAKTNLSTYVPKSFNHENFSDDSFRNFPNFQVGKPKHFGQQKDCFGEGETLTKGNLFTYVPKSLENLTDDSFRNFPNFQVGKPKHFGQQKECFGEEETLAKTNLSTYVPKSFNHENFADDSFRNFPNFQVGKPKHFGQQKDCFGEGETLTKANLFTYVPKSLENLTDDSFRNFPNFQVGKPKHFGQQKECFGEEETLAKTNLSTYVPKSFNHENFADDSFRNFPNFQVGKPKHFGQQKDCFGEEETLAKTNVSTYVPKSLENLADDSFRNFPNFQVGKPKHFGLQKECFGEEETFIDKKQETFVKKQNETVQPRRILKKRCVSEESVVDNDLDHHDLRHLLLAKRRISTDEITDLVGGKRIKTCYSRTNNEGNVSKKKVTFNLDMNVSDETESCEEKEANGKAISINSLHELGSNMKQEKWYIVVDFDVLTQHFDFLDSYVQSDNNCILLIPIAVRKEIENLCVGESAGKRLMMAARHLARKIDNCSHIKVQLCEEDTKPDSSMPDSILQCCLQVQEDQYHVILITENDDLYMEAEANGIYCFKIQEIKDGAEYKTSFDPKKIAEPKTSLEVKENYFLPDNIPVNCFRKKLFEFDTNDDENKENGRLFFQTSDVNVKEEVKDNYIENKNLFLFSDCNNKAKTIIPPKNKCDDGNIENGHLFQRNFKSNPKKDLKESHIEYKKSFLFNDYGNKVKANHPPRSIMRSVDCSDDTNLSLLSFEIKKINIVEIPNKEIASKKQNKIVFNKKAQGNTKRAAMSVNSYNVNNHLKKFCKEYKINEESFALRVEEIVCSFTQVMEESLTEVLQENQTAISSKYTAPYTLMEAIECTREMYDDPSLKVVVEKFIYLLVKYFGYSGKLRPNIKPCEFMMLLGCGVLLIRCLSNILSSPQYLIEAERCLLKLSKEVCSICVLHSPPAKHTCTEEHTESRANFVKSPSEIMMYLKRHYPDWRHTDYNCNKVTDKIQEKVPNIIRSTGNKIKINHNKNISLIESEPSGKQNKDDFYNSKVYNMYIKNFLLNLSDIFHNFHQFLNSVTEIKDDITEQEKKKMNYKAVIAQNCIEKIIDYLRGIIEREYDESTELNSKLPRSIKYRQIIEKYLEQAKALQNLLKSYKI